MDRFEVNKEYTCPGQYGGTIQIKVLGKTEDLLTYCYEGVGRKYVRAIVIINNVEHVKAW